MDGEPRIDRTRPHSARVWNYLLGGTDNFPVDRQTGDELLRTFPDFAQVARLQRDFLRRVVGYLVTEVGIRQFLDLGSGLPTAGNTR
ncbi:SAM-dependent methyltransferase [[Actinomadura] parvosata]|uniref:SAM-dependent methyltransferase n=1 Tax=[Actinomadura] parvosata TaxID=1955412 RepID=UPI00406C4F20